MADDKYEMLCCIKNCPDTYVTKAIIFNVIHWNYGKIDLIIDILANEKLINVLKIGDNTEYSVSILGEEYIKNYPKNLQKDKFDKYIFPVILSILGIIVSLVTYLM